MFKIFWKIQIEQGNLSGKYFLLGRIDCLVFQILLLILLLIMLCPIPRVFFWLLMGVIVLGVIAFLLQVFIVAFIAVLMMGIEWIAMMVQGIIG